MVAVGVLAQLLILAAAPCFAAPQVARSAGLRAGATLKGQVVPDDPIVSTPALDRDAPDAPVRGKTLRVEVQRPGTYRLELGSEDFDAYLVFSDGQGRVLAESHGGGPGLDALLWVELESGRAYQAAACAAFEERGEFELRLRATAEVAEPAADPDIELDRARDRLGHVEARFGPDDPALASSLMQLATLLVDAGQYREARAFAERALAIRQARFGSRHTSTAACLHLMGNVLRLLAQHAAAEEALRRASTLRAEILGAEHPLALGSTAELARVLYAAGRYEEAREHCARVLAVRERSRGPDHPETARARHDLATVLLSLGEIDAAIADLERTLELRQRLFGDVHEDTVSTLTNLALAYDEAGRPRDARPLLERALAGIEALYGPDHPRTAMAAHNLATQLWHLGLLEEAEPLFRRAAEDLELALGPDHPDLASVLDNHGGLLKNRGDFDGAQDRLERALAIRERALGPVHPFTATSLNNVAALLDDRGDYEGARVLYERALEAFEAALGPDHPHTLSSKVNLAGLLRDLGDLGTSRQLLEEILSANRRLLGDAHPQTATSLNALATALEDLGDFEAARPLYEESLLRCEDSLGSEHPTTNSVRQNLALLLQKLGEVEEAGFLFEEAVAIAERTQGPWHPGTAKVRTNYATLLGMGGSHDAARAALERSLEGLQRSLGGAHPDVALCLNSLAVTNKRAGRFEVARGYYERALSIYEPSLGSDHPRTAETSTNLALLLADCGDLEAARAVLARHGIGRRRALEGVLGSLTERERYLHVAQYLWRMEARVSLATLPDAPGDEEATYAEVLTWKGGVTRSLWQSRDRLARDLPDGAQGLLEELRECQRLLSRLTSTTGGDAGRVAAEVERRNRLELALHRLLDQGGAGSTSFPSGIRDALPEGAALLDFLVHDVYQPGSASQARAGTWLGPHLSVWITRGDRQGTIHIGLGPAQVMEQLVSDLLEQSLTVTRAGRGVPVAESPGTGEPSAAALREALWDPIEPHVADASLVFVAPDAFLGSLPFEAIELADGTFLLEQHSFAYVEEPLWLTRAGALDGSSEPSLLCVGGLTYAQAAGAAREAATGRASPVAAHALAWPELPGTRTESEAIHALHATVFGPDVSRTLLVEGQGTEASLKREAPSYAILHLATHGFFQPEGLRSQWDVARGAGGSGATAAEAHHPGLLSGLVCAAGADTGDAGEDGYLTAEELSWLDLSRVELATLSACRTGLGRTRAAEGMIGLRRSLRSGGVDTVVSSLWSVPDRETSRLMRDFYENLWTRGMGRLAALRAAQLAMLRRNRELHGHPRPETWAAFVLSGEWR